MKHLRRHLREAIALNRTRRPLYAHLSEGATRKYTARLIFFEKMALIPAWYFDWKGDWYQRRGVPFIKEDFVEMALTPVFAPLYPAGMDYAAPLKTVDLFFFKKTLKSNAKSCNFKQIVLICQQLLRELQKQPHLYCMLRHLVESIHRVAHLAPLHAERCEKLGLPLTVEHSRRLIRAHIWLLGAAKRMDEQVAVIQNKGIPFLYQDLPAIERSTFYEDYP